MNNLFFKTRIRLTLLYIAIIIVLLLIFSQIIYISFANNIKNNVEGNFLTKQQEAAFVKRQINSLQITLFFANAVILILVGGTSYFLAGRTLGPIQKAMEQQKQFLSDASHELRTPLAVLQTNMDIALKEKTGHTKEHKEIQSNLEEVERMSSLVDELLLLSRLDTTNLSVSLTNMNLLDLLQNTVKRFEVYAKHRQVSLELVHLPSFPLLIAGNQDMLSKAIGNVIKNAIDYNRKNGKVLISLEKKRKMAVITVRDTGFGIPSKHLPYIFDRFYKGEESRSEHKGSGLGLAIAEGIITKHKGTITIESTSPKGTTAHISLPLSSTS